MKLICAVAHFFWDWIFDFLCSPFAVFLREYRIILSLFFYISRQLFRSHFFPHRSWYVLQTSYVLIQAFSRKITDPFVSQMIKKYDEWISRYPYETISSWTSLSTVDIGLFDFLGVSIHQSVQFCLKFSTRKITVNFIHIPKCIIN
jgi:hypothetical protein